MKNSRIILAALAIFAAVSCQKEGFDNFEQNRQTESATINTGNPTKTFLDGNEVHWSSDDMIAVFDNYGKRNVFNVTQTQGNYASFSGSVTKGTKQIYAVYPASLANSINGSSINVTIPSDQTSKVASFAEEHNISVAKAAKTPGVESIGNVTFANVCSYLKFEVPSYIGDVQEVTFAADVALAGEATINYSSEKPVLSVASNGSKSVTMKGNYPAESEFLFVLAPTTISEFTVTVVTKQLTWTYSKKAEVQFTAGKYKILGVLPLESVTASAKATHTYDGSTLTGTSVVVNLSVPSSVQIYDKLQSVSLVIKNSNGDEVRSVSDVKVAEDVKSVTFEPTEEWPYLPLGDYTVSGTYTLESGAVKSIQTPLTVGKPEFSVTSNAYTSYTKYQTSGASAANEVKNDAICDITSATVAISDAIMNNSKYSRLKGGFSYALDDEATTSANVTNQSWGKHTVTATYTFDGAACSGTADCHVTGLPYSRTSMKEDEWSFASWNCKFSGGVIQLGGVMGSGEASANSKMSFHIPATVNIKLNTNATVRALKFGLIYNTDFTVSVNGTRIIKQNSNKESDGRNYNLSGTTTISSGLSIKLNSSYEAAGPWSKVHSMEILYN